MIDLNGCRPCLAAPSSGKEARRAIMAVQDNVQQVQNIYSAFGRGDIFQGDKVARFHTFEDTAAVAAAFDQG